jgi:hypothetical protein
MAADRLRRRKGHAEYLIVFLFNSAKTKVDRNYI